MIFSNDSSNTIWKISISNAIPSALRSTLAKASLHNLFAVKCNKLQQPQFLKPTKTIMIVQSYLRLMSTLTLKSNTVLTQSIINLAHHVFNQIKKQNKQTGFKKKKIPKHKLKLIKNKMNWMKKISQRSSSTLLKIKRN